MIYIASDHGGFELKEELKKHLLEKEIKVEDLGNIKFEKEDDYPDFILPLAKKISKETDSLGIILGRSGNGEAIVANKVKGVRAAVCMNEVMAQKAREHNHANVLSLGADYVNSEEAKRIVDAFLTTDFSKEEKHVRRVEKITSYEAS